MTQEQDWQEEAQEAIEHARLLMAANRTAMRHRRQAQQSWDRQERSEREGWANP